jgi:hypothetical protein
MQAWPHGVTARRQRDSVRSAGWPKGRRRKPWAKIIRKERRNDRTRSGWETVRVAGLRRRKEMGCESGNLRTGMGDVQSRRLDAVAGRQVRGRAVERWTETAGFGSVRVRTFGSAVHERSARLEVYRDNGSVDTRRGYGETGPCC